jgi:hypothetical protein
MFPNIPATYSEKHCELIQTIMNKNYFVSAILITPEIPLTK